jgi:hypothetical protein
MCEDPNTQRWFEVHVGACAKVKKMVVFKDEEEFSDITMYCI